MLFSIDNGASEPAALSPDFQRHANLICEGSVDMTSFKWPALCLIALMATVGGSAQQKFPLRSGEWTATTPDPTNTSQQPMTMLFCMNDATWTKAINGNPRCTMQQLNITSSGGSYSMTCAGQAFQMKGSFKLTFDGMTHMTTSGSIDTTANGKTSHMDSTTDFRWKGPTCNPSVDMNLRDFHKPPQ
jgi:hypothetical protein